METPKFEARHHRSDKRFWSNVFRITWAAVLEGNMMWLRRQDSSKQKFGDLKPQIDSEKASENQ